MGVGICTVLYSHCAGAAITIPTLLMFTSYIFRKSSSQPISSPVTPQPANPSVVITGANQFTALFSDSVKCLIDMETKPSPLGKVFLLPFTFIPCALFFQGCSLYFSHFCQFWGCGLELGFGGWFFYLIGIGGVVWVILGFLGFGLFI